MRDTLGNLVGLRAIEPWGMHLLTSDSANGKGAEIDEIKPPEELSLIKLAPIEVEMQIEQHIVWMMTFEDKPPVSAALPRPFVEAFTKYAPSSLPIVRAINTMPIISLAGTVISGVGLDRESSLIHRIDPLLLDCVGNTEATDDDGRWAVNVYKECLIDVAVATIGDFYKIVLLNLSLIQGAIMPARPIYIITAPERGGGKSTLAHMLSMAVAGRMASATAWRAREEERAQALFAHLRRSPTMLVFDNLPRGAEIQSAALEVASTNMTMTDRILGLSETEVVPSTAILIFTGNQISAKGDTASRCLKINLLLTRRSRSIATSRTRTRLSGPHSIGLS
jgi:hypothetical protein